MDHVLTATPAKDSTSTLPPVFLIAEWPPPTATTPATPPVNAPPASTTASPALLRHSASHASQATTSTPTTGAVWHFAK